jgi:hypothetical protein
MLCLLASATPAPVPAEMAATKAVVLGPLRSSAACLDELNIRILLLSLTVEKETRFS